MAYILNRYALRTAVQPKSFTNLAHYKNCHLHAIKCNK